MHSPNNPYSYGWVRLKLGTRNSTWVSNDGGGRDHAGIQILESPPVVSQGTHEQKAGTRSRAGICTPEPGGHPRKHPLTEDWNEGSESSLGLLVGKEGGRARLSG